MRAIYISIPFECMFRCYDDELEDFICKVTSIPCSYHTVFPDKCHLPVVKE